VTLDHGNQCELISGNEGASVTALKNISEQLTQQVIPSLAKSVDS